MQILRNTGIALIVMALFIALSSTTSCTSDPFIVDPIDTIPIDTIIPPDSSSTCDPDSIYFRKDVLPIIMSSCGMTFCHNSVTKAGGVEITSYETILASGIAIPFDAEGSSMYQRMNESDLTEVMPPDPRGPISDTNIIVIKRWIDQGALKLDCPDDTTCIIVAPVSFSKDVFPIIDKYCKGCHSGANPWDGLYLRDYDDIKVVADNGKLVGVIEHAMGFPEMPKDIDKLLQCDIDRITMWVNDGAEDN